MIKQLYNSTGRGSISLQPNLENLNSEVYIVHVKGDKGLKLSGKLITSR